jgi:hypothetical protein
MKKKLMRWFTVAFISFMIVAMLLIYTFPSLGQ